MASQTLRKRRIVMVDDDVDFARQVENRCRTASIHFRPPALATREWAESLEAVDLLIWSWKKLALPANRRLVGEIRSRHPDLPMLVIDLDLSQEGADEIVEGRATDFVRSPMDLDEVACRIDRLLIHGDPVLGKAGRTTPKSSLRGVGEGEASIESGATPAGGMPFEHVAVDLRNPSTGRLDARQVSDLFNIPMRRIASLVGHRPQTLSKTPDSRALQPGLAVFERIACALMSLVGSAQGLRIWMNAANPELSGQVPSDLLMQGQGQVVADLLESMLAGQPA